MLPTSPATSSLAFSLAPWPSAKLWASAASTARAEGRSDNAGPVDAVWELAEVGWLNAQHDDDDVADLNNLPSPDVRARQLAVIVDGYELERSDRSGVVDKMIQFAIRSAREEAISYAVRPDTTSPAVDGYPILWGVTWRARAAAWIHDHRQILDTALGV
jgi:hypothetical protein